MSYLMNSLNKGLVLHLPLDQVHKQGSLYADLSPYSNPGTPVNAPTATTDRFGRENRALAFDGVNQYVTVNPGGLSGAYSVCFWAKHNNTGTDYIVDFRNSDGSGAGYILRTGASNLLNIPSGTGYINGIQTTVWPGDASWHFVLVSGISITTFDLFHIGTRYNFNAAFWDGDMHDFKVFNYALSQAEVTALYNLGDTGNMLMRG